MKHPGEADLALYAGGDLPFWKRWLTGLHVRSCGHCRSELALFRDERELVGEVAKQLPADLDWDELALEMRANIRVGLRADECVGRPEPRPHRIGWRAAAALASVTVVIVSGWWLHMARPDGETAIAGGTVASVTAAGIELLEDGRALTLLHESSGPVLVTASVDGAMSARYIDDETGMVTINNVYVQ